jgi:hypothetical protein
MATKKPPAPPKGNKRALKHGIHAKPDEKHIKEAESALAATLPAIDPKADAVALRLLAVSVIRYEQAVAEVNMRGVFDRRGKPTSAARWERRHNNSLMRQLAAFGGTPNSRAKMGLRMAKAVDLANVLSEPDDVKRRELMKEAGLAD